MYSGFLSIMSAVFNSTQDAIQNEGHVLHQVLLYQTDTIIQVALQHQDDKEHLERAT